MASFLIIISTLIVTGASSISSIVMELAIRVIKKIPLNTKVKIYTSGGIM
jgi:hypothetical protein